MREYPLRAPSNAVASQSDDRKHWALKVMADSLGADIRPTTAREVRE